MNRDTVIKFAQPCVALLSMVMVVGCGAEANVATAPAGQDATTAGDSATVDGSALDGSAVNGGVADAGGAQDAGGTVDTAAVVDAGTDGSSAEDATSDDTGAVPDATDAGAAPDAGSPAPDSASGGDAVDMGWGPAQCPVGGPPSGFGIGQTLGDLPVQDCDTGKVRTIKEVCGAKATWVFVAHSHCPTCRATATYTAQVAKQVADKGVAVVHVVQIDDGQTCPSWRKKYGLEGIKNLRVYTDTSGKAWQSIKTSNYTAPHAFADGGRVITYKKHGLSSQAVIQKINEALAGK